MKKLLLSLTLICTATAFSQPTFEWAKSMGGTGQDYGISITTDASGNVYTMGRFQNTVDFDPGAGTFNLTSNGDADIFIQKLDANGTFIWAKSMGGAGEDHGRSITTDAAGNVYTTGNFYGAVDFDPGAGTFNLTTNGGTDIFIQKLDESGTFIWAKSMGGTSGSFGWSITTDAAGNVYTTGNFYGAVDFDPGAGTFNVTSNGSDDIFIQKLDANGNFLWAKGMGGTGSDAGNSITTDALGNVCTTGDFESTVDFDPGAGTYNLTSNGLDDIFIQKLDASGTFIWAKSMGGTGIDIGKSITTDASGNVYTTGYFQNTVDFDPGAGTFNLTTNGGSDIFIQKLDANGTFIWAKSMGGAGEDYGYSITTDASGNVYTTGYFESLVDFDPGAGTFNLTINGGTDIFIQKLDESGTFIWAKSMGGAGYDFGQSITTDASGNVYTTGGFGGTVDFDPEAGTFNLYSNGSADIFIQKLSQTGVGIIENDFGNNLRVYPNPSDGNFSIDLGLNFESVKVHVRDITGKLVLSKTYNESQLLNLKLEEAAGVYLLIIEAEGKKAMIRLVKE